MPAKSMFRKLGYKLMLKSSTYFLYFKEYKNKAIVIQFDKQKKTISKFKCGLAVEYQDIEDLEINLEELQAIIKQVEELEWNK